MSLFSSGLPVLVSLASSRSSLLTLAGTLLSSESQLNLRFFTLSTSLFVGLFLPFFVVEIDDDNDDVDRDEALESFRDLFDLLNSFVFELASITRFLPVF